MFLDDLASRIRQQRERLSLTQDALARALNVTPQAVSKWERGENAPDISLLVPLAALFEVSIDWLLAPGRPEPPAPGLKIGRFRSSVEGYGFVHSAAWADATGDAVAADSDVYISPSLIRRYRLASGDTVRCHWRPAQGAERFASAVDIVEVNGRPPASIQPPASGALGDAPQTPRSRKAMAVAAEEAKQYNHQFLGTEHILLALIGGGGRATDAMVGLGIDLQRLRAETEGLMQPGPETVARGELPLTPSARAAVQQARCEAQQYGDGSLGTGHLLLGVLAQTEDPAAMALSDLGVTPDQVRRFTDTHRSR